jgi:ferric-dicitrate binding protein FerR (iron transport regulator)
MDAHIEALMVKVTDSTASPGEREELMSILSERPDLALELDQHRGLKAVTDGWVARLELDLAEDRHRKQPATRWLEHLGVALVVGGYALLMGWSAVDIFLDPEVPLMVQVSVGAMVGGIAVLLAAVIRWRLQVRKTDRYTEVIR